MIEKLKKKIFILIMTSLSIIVIGIITIFCILNCTNTIMYSRKNIDKLTKMKESPGWQDIRIKPDIQAFINEEKEKTDKHITAVIIFSTLISGLSLVIIYKISKKTSEILVKPVFQTFEKQKQFISDASHELKTPLAVIEANTEVLENEIGNNKWLTYIKNETESMDKLINELLLLAKTENVEEIKTYEQIDLSKETKIIVAMFESVAYEKQIKISLKVQPNIFIRGNKQDIEHVLLTLIDNAIKHCIIGKKVHIELKIEKNNIVLKVKNEGQAIPENQREKIFERFYRIDQSRNREEKRYGLGLAIAKASVEKYNGKIHVECKDGITCFKVILPADKIYKKNLQC